MALAVTNLDSGSSGSTASSYSTNSITPTANNLVLLSVFQRSPTRPGNVPTATGNSLTWVQVATVTDSVPGASTTTLFRALGASPTTGVVTIDFAAQNQSEILWTIDQWSGTDTTGTNGSGAVVQSATNEAEVANTSLTVTLSAFGSVNNATYGIFKKNEAITAGGSFTQLVQPSTASPTHLLSEYALSNQTSVNATWGSSGSTAMGIGIEIKAATFTFQQLIPSDQPSSFLKPKQYQHLYPSFTIDPYALTLSQKTNVIGFSQVSTNIFIKNNILVY